jgi:hypothetical protein
MSENEIHLGFTLPSFHLGSLGLWRGWFVTKGSAMTSRSHAMGVDRRVDRRDDAFGKAWIVLDDATAIPYQVENMSSGGALLAEGPPLPWRESFAMVLRVPGLPALEVTARLAWQTEGASPRYGVRFVSADSGVADAICDIACAMVGDRRAEVPALREGSLATWLP